MKNEILENVENCNEKQFHYISAPSGLFAVYTKETGQNDKLQYIHTDHLGSIQTITDESGQIDATYSYDAWGRQRDATNWFLYYTTPLQAFSRGYTGHEHLSDFGLINMNGRLYDPVLGRMLSPDNYVQMPGNSQNYNRYSYCMNNPLIYTDPSGEFWHLAIGAVIGGFTNWSANGHDFSWKGLGHFGVGALTGALSAGVGVGIQTAASGAAFGAGFVGSTHGISTILSVGYTSSFANGFIAGAGAGFAGGFVSSTGNGLLAGKSFDQALGSGLISGGYGALFGGISGGIMGGIDAALDGRHFLTGKPPYKDVSLEIPFVGQEPNSMDCMLANSEMLEKFFGGTRTIDNFREIYNDLPAGATSSDYYSAAGFNVMGNPKTGMHIARTMEVNKFPTTIIYNEGTYNGRVLDHNITITRIRMWTPKSKFVLWVNDPARGTNIRWSQRELERVLIELINIGGIN
ncbi:MAG: RHS repeat-associated core domain-containing protein [Bacteroidetes bacterium]|nr:RHS repeat-associated core domain-containing protein [Bacteroidota bacterium]MBT7143521.1 RHS repeat-associated core domain-containing protein [Bacteroidota bacterium]MBT7493086.1 RHS repeat-associated core domain-containing protein [Bacteroidota bacterium]